MADNYQVYASESVLQKLDFITTYIPETAKVDTIIVSGDDLLRRGQALPEVELLAPLYEGEPEQLVLARSGLKALFNEFAKDYGLDTDQIREITRAKIAATAIDGTANAIPLDFDSDGINDLGIIVTPYLDRSAAETDALFTGFPIELMVNPTVTEFENLAMTMWHEAGHLSQPAIVAYNREIGYGKMPLPYEIDADQKAIQTYLQAVEDGHALDKEFTQDFIDKRLVGSFAAPGADTDLAFAYTGLGAANVIDQETDTVSHSTHFALNSDGTIPDLSNLMTVNTPESEQLSGMMFANAAVNMTLGQDFLQNTVFKELQETGTVSHETEGLLGPNHADIGLLVHAITKDVLKTGELSEKTEFIIRAGDYRDIDADDLIEKVVSEVKENGFISEQTQDAMSIRDHTFSSVMEHMQPMKMADIGTKIAENDPVKGLAAGQALLNKMPALQEHPMGEYIEKIHEFFAQRGSNIRQHPEYFESLEHFTLLLDAEISAANEPSNNLDTEDLSVTTQSLDELVENHFSNLMVAAQDAGNEEALEKLQAAYAEYSGTGINGKNRAESGNDLYKADQTVDAAREAMKASIHITADHHDLMQHYPSDDILQSPLSRLKAYNEGFDEISRISQSIEVDAVQLNNDNASPVAKVEIGPNPS